MENNPATFRNSVHNFYYRLIWVIIFFSLHTICIFCQGKEYFRAFTDMAEELVSEDADPESVSILLEQLNDLSENPVRINAPGENDLSRLFFLSELQIRSVADYIRSSGKIMSVYELAAIPGFDRPTVEMMMPFISLDNEADINDHPYTGRINNSMLTNVILSSGERDSMMLGSAVKILTKYRISTGRFSAGLTAEKDPGEELFAGKPPLPDFISGNITYNGVKKLKKIIIGDYSARFGLGTNINSGIRTGLLLTSGNYIPGRNEIKPYTSSDENRFFRGIAVELASGRTGLTVFYSSRKIDASLDLTEDSTECISSFYRTGIHNTARLMSNKQTAAEESYGVNLFGSFNNLRAGIVWSENRLSVPVIPEKTDPENHYDFEGKRNGTGTIYFNWLINKFLFFGEISGSNFLKEPALVQGCQIKATDRLSVNILYRDYSPGFTSFHGNGPGRNSLTSNEKGIMSNITFEAARHLFINAGCDICYYPWLRYRCSAPSLSVSKEIKLQYLPSDNFETTFMYTSRNYTWDSPRLTGIAGTLDQKDRTFKMTVRYSGSAGITLTTHIYYKISEPTGSRGVLMSQDFIYRSSLKPLTFWYRHCIYNTDDWNSRLYVYENDLLYSYSIPAFYGKGSRSYLMINWEAGRSADLRIKYGFTTFPSEDAISRDKSEIRLQLRLEF